MLVINFHEVRCMWGRNEGGGEVARISKMKGVSTRPAQVPPGTANYVGHVRKTLNNNDLDQVADQRFSLK